jgi:hypothetical protein
MPTGDILADITPTAMLRLLQVLFGRCPAKAKTQATGWGEGNMHQPRFYSAGCPWAPALVLCAWRRRRRFIRRACQLTTALLNSTRLSGI